VAAQLDLLWRVRATAVRDDADENALSVNPRGDILAAQGLPGYTEQTRLQNTWGVREATPSAPGVSLPTTLAGITLWNGEPDAGKLYLIQRISAVVTTTAAAVSPVGLSHLINVGKKTAPASAGLTIRGLAGQRYDGNAVVGVGITVTDDGWEPIGNSIPAPTGNVGMGVEAVIDGFFIVPPGYMYSAFALMNNGAAARTVVGIRWMELAIGIRG
jgi:hypothetical protein